MYIVCACDEKFLPHTATMLCSLLENNDMVTCVYLLHSGLKTHHLDVLGRFVRTYGSHLEAFTVDNKLLSSLKIDKHASVANYYRLLIPELLPTAIDKVLYLDSDLIVRKPLNPLWDVSLEGYPLAAVEEVGFSDHDRLGIARSSKYFNSGVLLLNLTEWRQNHISQKVIDFIRRNPERVEFWDQDGLNAVLVDHWLELPLQWNVGHTLFFDPGFKIRYADIIEDPSIVHFSGNHLKPWQYGVQHPFRVEYEKYRRKTAWSRYKPEGIPGVMTRIRRQVKQAVRRQISTLARKESFWNYKLVREMFNILKFILTERENEVRRHDRKHQLDELRRDLEKLVPDCKVVGGPFKGLKYPKLESIGSALAPKMLGTYEAELHNRIEEICERGYSTIVNIGCAEGYYAVGLAMRIPEAKVYAYDIDPIARELCYEMARLNSVADRVTVSTHFTMRTLRGINCEKRGLIVSDCEGAEKFIFYTDIETWPYLVTSFDLLVEVHEFIHPGVSCYLFDLFSESHCIERISSIPDWLRPRVFRCELLERQNMDIEAKIRLMAEHRPCTMEWLFMKKKGSPD